MSLQLPPRHKARVGDGGGLMATADVKFTPLLGLCSQQGLEQALGTNDPDIRCQVPCQLVSY